MVESDVKVLNVTCHLTGLCTWQSFSTRASYGNVTIIVWGVSEDVYLIVAALGSASPRLHGLKTLKNFRIFMCLLFINYDSIYY